MSIDPTPGTLVKARNREWVVLPESTEEMWMLRPIGGLDDEITGVIPSIESIRPATFQSPNPDQAGDFVSCRRLRDAARLANQTATGPFRSFGKLAVTPRPYQLVPLMMALRQETVRLLIADDTGIGKTIEASMIAKELLERGEIERMAVLCPPHLAQQWQQHLADMFHIQAELVLNSTVRKLEKGLAVGESIFERYPHLVISIDYIKSARHRDDFIRTCPELVIVDEAHTCTSGGGRGQGRQQRYQLVKDIAKEEKRHVVLVTATPHTGNQEAFKSLLGHLNPDFVNLPDDLSGRQNESARKRLARYLVQRRRVDIRSYLEQDTKFPDRLQMEKSYLLTEEYKALFQEVLAYSRELLDSEDGGRRQQRVRYWSVLSLLRSLASSPRAAASTLRNRAQNADVEDPDQVDELGRATVLDLEDGTGDEVNDVAPGALIATDTQERERERQRLVSMAEKAEALEGKQKDQKLKGIIAEVKKLLKEGFHPILFCRFIPTAQYLAEELRKEFKTYTVESVTGHLSADERSQKIEELIQNDRRILVCTDCLSEGINLQDGFDAVIHYDLAWNPTRLEQREGRVDRFGQTNEEVKILTYFGRDTQIDGVILDVLLRKSNEIRQSLGISLALPVRTEEIVEAIFEGLVFRESQGGNVAQLELDFSTVEEKTQEVHAQWERAADKESAQRSLFAQQTISETEVAEELEKVVSSLGGAGLARNFVLDVFDANNVGIERVTDSPPVHRFLVNMETDRALRNAIGRDDAFTGKYDLPVDRSAGEVYLDRTSPTVHGLASHVLGQALDDQDHASVSGAALARRCGLTVTDSVAEKTTLLLVRYRYHLNVSYRNKERTLLAEELRVEAFCGSASEPQWLPNKRAEELLEATPSGNRPPDLIKRQLQKVLDHESDLQDHFRKVSEGRAQELREDHVSVRESARQSGNIEIEPVDPPDLLGLFILLPGEGR